MRPPDFGAKLATVDRDDDEALVAALPAKTDALVDIVAYTPGHAAQLLMLQGRVESLGLISSASVYADEQGRTIDEATDEASFPELPVPIPETQLTVRPGDATYSTQKAAMEQTLLEQDAIPVTVLRPCAIHGPGAEGAREWWVVGRARDVRRYLPLAYGGGTTFHPTSTANLAELACLAAEQPGTRVLNCGDPDPPDVRTQSGPTTSARLALAWPTARAGALRLPLVHADAQIGLSAPIAQATLQATLDGRLETSGQ